MAFLAILLLLLLVLLVVRRADSVRCLKAYRQMGPGGAVQQQGGWLVVLPALPPVLFTKPPQVLPDVSFCVFEISSLRP